MIHKLLLAFALGVFVNLILPLTTSGMSPSKQVPSSGGQGPGSSGSPLPSPPMPPSGCSDSSCTPMPPSYNPYNSEMVGSYSQCNLPAILKQRHEERLKVLNKSICVTKEEKEKFELLNDDKIIIPKKTGIVTVSGEVLKEGKVQFISEESLSYYIDKAGGFSNYADKTKIAIVYPNGNVEIKKWFSKI